METLRPQNIILYVLMHGKFPSRGLWLIGEGIIILLGRGGGLLSFEMKRMHGDLHDSWISRFIGRKGLRESL